MDELNKNKKKDIISEWIKLVLVVISSGVLFTSVIYFNIYTFVWISFLAFMTYRFLYKKYLTDHNWNMAVAIILFFGFILFIFNDLQKKPILNNTQYVGIYGVNEGSPEEKFSLYDTDYYYKNEEDELSHKFENVGKEYFIFWQTGVAEGYTPYKISFYNNESNLISYLENFFHIGAIAFLEIILISFKNILITMVCFLLFNLFFNFKYRSNKRDFITPITID
jgi:hypothetical protein